MVYVPTEVCVWREMLEEDGVDIGGCTVCVKKLMVGVVLGEVLNQIHGVCERVKLGLMVYYFDEKVLRKALDEMRVL
jgi:hypothetical protein